MNDQERDRRKKLEELRNIQGDPFSIEKIRCNSSIGELIGEAKRLNYEENSLNSLDLSLVGRIVSIRQSFFTLKDSEHRLQLYFKAENCRDELTRKAVELLDLGDVVYVRGSLFMTQRQQLTLRIGELRIVSKCLNPFPSEYYGIKDDKLRFKNRVGQLLVNDDFYGTLLRRSQIIFFIRKYLHERGYIEFETPILDSNYGGANAVPFVTRCESLKEDFFLRIATEISLKKAVISGYPRVFEIGKVFRNEGIDSTHNPEFTSLEIYTVNHGLEETMQLTEEIIRGSARELKIERVMVSDQEISLDKPFSRVHMHELVLKETGIDFYNEEVSLERAMAEAKRLNIELDSWENMVGHVFHKIFDKLSERLIEPTFVIGFHRDVSPLSKSDPKNPNFTLRYELYIGGMEYSNGFAELNDPDEQRRRFEDQREERIRGNKEAFDMDESFLFAMKYGLPPTGGIGIGIDRLVMLLTNQRSIKETLFQPIVKK